jgi:hypothetical protein
LALGARNLVARLLHAQLLLMNSFIAGALQVLDRL